MTAQIFRANSGDVANGTCGREAGCTDAVIGLVDVELSWLGSTGGGVAHAADFGGGIIVIG